MNVRLPATFIVATPSSQPSNDLPLADHKLKLFAPIDRASELLSEVAGPEQRKETRAEGQGHAQTRNGNELVHDDHPARDDAGVASAAPGRTDETRLFRHQAARPTFWVSEWMAASVVCGAPRPSSKQARHPDSAREPKIGDCQRVRSAGECVGEGTAVAQEDSYNSRSSGVIGSGTQIRA